MGYFHLVIAILCELVGTMALKESLSFSRLLPSLVCALGYLSAFYFMSLSMKTIPVAVSYAIWSALGLVLITVVSAYRFNEQPDLPALIGLSLIVVGVFCLTGLSKMDVHA